MHYPRTLPEEEKIYLERIRQDYFSNPLHPIKIDVEVEGQFIDDNKNFLIGCIAGPSSSIENLIHEMAHFAEREPNKLLRRPRSSWGLNYGKQQVILGKVFNEPATAQGVKRELRVWAFQINIQKHYEIPVDPEELVESIVYVNSFCNYHLFKDREKDITYTEKERKAIALQEVLELTKTFTYKQFKENWDHRINLLLKQKLKR